MTFDGRSVTLDPSIGNWQKDCGSHYWIVENRIRWARRWSDEEISAGFKNDIRAKQEYYGEASHSSSADPLLGTADREGEKPSSVREAWLKLKRKLF
jgi:hypothetical protein